MSHPAIKVENLYKKYTMGAARQSYGTFYDLLTHSIKAPFKRTRKQGGQSEISDQFWALRDINFEIQPGEVVGVIGRNGAGKSTLLKILSRITGPTHGRIEVRGRLASLLEVGTGFHPELSGRENVFLNGAILGMSHSEVKLKFDEIVSFAEVEKFIDTPVKRYSSGMYVRLAFAVAAYLEPEVLIIDEVLAVGDAAFQKKCLGKLKDVAHGGRTVLFVSHNLRSIADMCTSAILVEDGRIAGRGTPREVVSQYLSDGGTDETEWLPARDDGAPFCFNRLRILNAATGKGYEGFLPYNDPFAIEINYTTQGSLPDGRLAVKLTNEEGLVVFCSSDTDMTSNARRPWLSGQFISRCEIPGNLLCAGKYSVGISQPRADGSDIIHEDVLTFTINGLGNPSERDGRSGVISPLLIWTNTREIS